MTNGIRGNIAESIRELRKRQKLTQEELAEKCDLSPSYISRLECKKQNVSLKTLEKISDALGVSSNTLLLQVLHADKKNGNSLASELLAILNSVGQEAAEMILEFAILIKKRFIKGEKTTSEKRPRKAPSRKANAKSGSEAKPSRKK